MNKEIEFEKWIETASPELVGEIARIPWNAAWDTLMRHVTSSEHTGRLLESYDEGMRANLLTLAVECFREKDDARSHFFRDLADPRHIFWSK